MDQCIDIYQRVAAEVFGKKSKYLPPRFDASILENVVLKTVEELVLREEADSDSEFSTAPLPEGWNLMLEKNVKSPFRTRTYVFRLFVRAQILKLCHL